MTSENIYRILISKTHNPHYLNRYWKFIQTFKTQIKIKGVTEYHHICPKSKDLFPEYSSLKQYDWNGIHLTKRQHYIAHYLLSKSYGGKQIYAFWAMVTKQSPNDSRERSYKISSRVYEQTKNIFQNQSSKDKKGKAAYIDKNNNIIYCNTNDQRVIHKEIISLSKGRKYKPRSEESKKKTSISLKSARYNPNKKVMLYKLHTKVEVLFYSKEYEEMLIDGWSTKCTPEYRTKISIESNNNISKESRKNAGKSISKSRKGKVFGPISIEGKKSRRKNDGRIYNKLYYNTKSNIFEYIDPFDINNNQILVFSKSNGSRKYDINGKHRLVNNDCPTPPGYYDLDPNKTILVLDKSLMLLCDIKFIEYSEINHIKISVPNGDRIKVFRTDTKKYIYLTKKLITEYGLPINCIYH